MRLEDPGSENRTSASEDDKLTDRVMLHDGDCIHLGPVVIVYHESGAGISKGLRLGQAPIRVVAVTM
jgi:hypothetical protein